MITLRRVVLSLLLAAAAVLAVVGFQLVAGYTGRLSIDGDHVPDSELRHVVGLNQFLYQPGPDKTLGALRPGTHGAVAELWPIGDPKDVSTQSWSFNAH